MRRFFGFKVPPQSFATVGPFDGEGLHGALLSQAKELVGGVVGQEVAPQVDLSHQVPLTDSQCYPRPHGVRIWRLPLKFHRQVVVANSKQRPDREF